MAEMNNNKKQQSKMYFIYLNFVSEKWASFSAVHRHLLVDKKSVWNQQNEMNYFINSLSLSLSHCFHLVELINDFLIEAQTLLSWHINSIGLTLNKSIIIHDFDKDIKEIANKTEIHNQNNKKEKG